MTARVLLVTGLCVAAAQNAPLPRWIPQTSGVTARLRGVSAVTDRIAWASGSNGTIIRTVDGGETWQKLAIPGTERLDFRDIDAIDARVAYVLSIGAGDASRIYKTEDGGRTWQAQFTNPDPKAFFDAMAFWDARNGIAVSDSVDGLFVIIVTHDGGQTWTRVPASALPPALPNEGAFAASGTNVAVHGTSHVWIGTGAAVSSRVLRSTDQGQTWAVAVTPLPAGPSAGIFSIAFHDASRGMVVGGDYRKEAEAIDNAAVTTDGGVTWTLRTGLSGYRSVVAYLPDAQRRAVLAVGPSGADYSDNDGADWKPLTGAGFHTVSVAREGRAAWGAGESGRVARLVLP